MGGITSMEDLILILVLSGIGLVTLQRLPQRNLRQTVSLKKIGAGGKEGDA